MPVFDLLSDQFINYLLVEKGLSKNSVEAYTNDLRRYFDFLKSEKITEPSPSDTDLIIRHLIAMRDAGSRRPFKGETFGDHPWVLWFFGPGTAHRR